MLDERLIYCARHYDRLKFIERHLCYGFIICISKRYRFINKCALFIQKMENVNHK